MTAAPTVTPYRSPGTPGKDGFRQLLHAEWTKFRTVRGWPVGMLVAVLVMTGIAAFVAAAGAQSSCQAVGGGPTRHGASCGPPVNLGPGGEPVTDNFYFARQLLDGDGSLTVRVTSLTGLLPPPGQSFTNPTLPGLMPWSKAGIIIRSNMSVGSAYAAMMVTGGNGVRMQWNFTGDTAGLPGTVSAASPRWLRLTRDGDTITGYDSADGAHWLTVGSVRLAGLPSTVSAGLFAASPNLPPKAVNIAGVPQGGEGQWTAATGAFDHLSKAGAWSPGGLTGGYVGGDDNALQYGIGAVHQAGGVLTVSGTGDLAPSIPGQDTGGGPAPVTVTLGLIGTFLGLIAVAVVAALFMTAEYRRGLIRTTLAASPRRGRVVAAKALVAGAVAFATGLLGAIAAVAVTTSIEHSRGAQLFPTPMTAELRIIVGTAALTAVFAVLTVAIAVMTRRGVAAVTIAIAAIVVPYFLAAVLILPVGVSDWLTRVTPTAAFAVQQAVPRYGQVTAYYAPVDGFYPLAPWAGLAVLCGWALAALAGAVYLLRRRDA